MLHLLRLQLRRDRIILPIWIIGIALLVFASTSSVGAEYGDQTEREGLLTLGLATPALIALRGIPDGGSLGSLIWFQIFAFVAFAIGLMNTFLAVRHGRQDEERGRRELVLAGAISRTSPLTATLLLGLGANVVLGLLSALAFLGAGLDAAGAFAAGLTFTVTGLAFLGIGVLVSQLTATSRGANGLAAAIVGVAYLLRAWGDATGKADLDKLTLTPTAPSWLSPIGWGEQVFPFTRGQLWPLLLSAALFVVGAAVAYLVQSRRDLGASLLPERGGPATGRLRTIPGLGWRLHWPSLLGWVIGAGLLGLVVANLATLAAGALQDNPQIQAVLESLAGGGEQPNVTVLFIVAIMQIVGMLAAAVGIQAVLRLREEESNGTAEEVLAGPTSRWRLMLSAVLIGTISVVAVMAFTAAAESIGFLIAGDSDAAARALGEALAFTPPALVFVGLAALAVAFLPRAAVAISWGLFGIGAVVGLFGSLLQLPDEVIDWTPWGAAPAIPVGDWTGVAVLLAAFVGLVALASVLFRRRDLVT
jgi:ABC-2 type transport system permease protein